MLTINEVETRWKKFVSQGSVYNSGIGNFFMNAGAMFTNDPYLLNQRVKNLKTTPTFMERELIENALMAPEGHELGLRTATRSMLYLTYPMYRLQMLYEGILKYKSYMQPKYVSKEEMNTPRFKSDWKFIDMWEKKLNPKKQFRRIVAELLAEGKKAYYLRQSYNCTTGKEKVNYVYLEELPSDYYKIIKHSTDSYEVVAFNFAYFWEAGTNLGQFPAIFSEYYAELMAGCVEKDGQRFINPELCPADVVIEYNSSTLEWFYWKELPANECFTYCFTESDDLQISPFVSLLLQAQDLGSYSLLQQQLLAVPLYSMILGEIPMSDNNKSGSHLDDLNLSPEAVAMFEHKVNGYMPPGTSYNMVPSVKNELHRFQEVPNAGSIYNHGLQQLVNTSGTSTLMTTTDKPSVAQVNAGKIIETRFIDRVYDQFAWSVNIMLRDMYDRGDLKFQWHFRIFGDSFSEKDVLSSLEKGLAVGHKELLPDYLAYWDKSLLDAVTICDWVESCDIMNTLVPMGNPASAVANGAKGTPNKVGRPSIDEGDINNDSTAASIDGGTNVIDTGGGS